MKSILAAALLALALTACSTEERSDARCAVIGESTVDSVPPSDKLWFKRNCTCEDTGKLDLARWNGHGFPDTIFVCSLRK